MRKNPDELIANSTVPELKKLCEDAIHETLHICGFFDRMGNIDCVSLEKRLLDSGLAGKRVKIEITVLD